MKLITALVFSLLMSFALADRLGLSGGNAPTGKPAPERKEFACIEGGVIRVFSNGLLCSVSLVDAGEHVTWTGEAVISGHPRLAKLAEGDAIGMFWARKIGTVRLDGRTLRAYRFEKMVPTK